MDDTEYTVVISRRAVRAQGEGRGTNGGEPRMTLYVRVGEPRPRVTGASVRFDGPDGLTSENLPAIDLAAIVSALAETASARSSESQLALFDSAAKESSSVMQSIPESSIPSTPGSDSVRDLSSAATAMPTAQSRPNELAGAGRRYRKMPDPKELRNNLDRIGTVTGLARFYDVPRHTAQGWVGRLKKIEISAEGR
ncbi:hypothetical protein [Nocardia sp. CNY236]|uniref:hypothetical protein n=1 Tax=Nocardia sp. CNY236 TaxID=1169152 RepID=UPI00048B12ED|nr:hypothetical protein [Nocardia sp. CNY236]